MSLLRKRRKCFSLFCPKQDLLSLTWLSLLYVIYLSLIISHSAPTYFGTVSKIVINNLSLMSRYLNNSFLFLYVSFLLPRSATYTVLFHDLINHCANHQRRKYPKLIHLSLDLIYQIYKIVYFGKQPENQLMKMSQIGNCKSLTHIG